LPASFWLVENRVKIGQQREARKLFERLLSLRNDVGLLSEEYDIHDQRFLGNFPQALSHIALINAGRALAECQGASAKND
jgi:GH15 family glucan-1,4-alpha-glucosidase